MFGRLRALLNSILGLPTRALKLITDTDNILLLAGLIAVLLGLLWFINPLLVSRFIPTVQYGVKCNDLGPPRGGGSRSLLSLRGNDFQNLRIDLRLGDSTIPQGEALDVNVIFQNEDIGPIILFMPENEALILNSGATLGVRLEIRDLNTGNLLTYSIPLAALPQGAAYREGELHLLEARARCRQSYKINPGLPVGEYTLRAIYSNTQPGLIQPRPNRTVDPGIPNQGVWVSTQGLSSPELRFSIVPPPTATFPTP
jgi:hypothetical protein